MTRIWRSVLEQIINEGEFKILRAGGQVGLRIFWFLQLVEACSVTLIIQGSHHSSCGRSKRVNRALQMLNWILNLFVWIWTVLADLRTSL